MPESADQKTPAAEMERQRLDIELDRELEATFPASDALKITRRQPDHPSRPKPRIGRVTRIDRRRSGLGV
jgi:hypothetical protein